MAALFRSLNPSIATLHLTVLGDSLGHGTGASRPAKGFTERIYRTLARDAGDHSFTNLSVPGATMSDVVTWQVSHVPAHTNTLLLVVGANDVPVMTDTNAFAAQYGKLLGRIRATAPVARLFVTGIPNIALTPHVPDDSKTFVASICATLSDRIREEASAHQGHFIDLFAITNRANGHAKRYLADDQFHPSDRGYALMARGALQIIQSELR